MFFAGLRMYTCAAFINTEPRMRPRILQNAPSHSSKIKVSHAECALPFIKKLSIASVGYTLRNGRANVEGNYAAVSPCERAGRTCKKPTTPARRQERTRKTTTPHSHQVCLFPRPGLARSTGRAFCRNAPANTRSSMAETERCQACISAPTPLGPRH